MEFGWEMIVAAVMGGFVWPLLKKAGAWLKSVLPQSVLDWWEARGE